ncbi:S-layer homology domain-containing protein [Bacillus ndiopicus]|uniref:S-layer homology domain-containing protein n=1 Tax=Bacillus ndiopicus TaxID=1347368 RepID=UPI0006942BBC|nr:S-layer homology domain-containing protein [Bacillus ndiopicus]
MKKSSKKMLASAAAVAVVASAVVPVASAASFKDLQGNMYANEISALVEAKVITGYPDGTFRPNQTLTRSDVVKLLGKYLVSLGYEIPNDYKTKMRFTDLTSQSQDELLQYAALVKDVGVFQGDAGKLLHRDELRRDQMASVLVRAFTVINDFGYVKYVRDQGFTSTLSDLNRTTHQDAITVLDYYDIVKGSSYNPKNATKRGEFAYFLYHILNAEIPTKEPEKPVLTLKKVEVTAADKLSVTLSDDKKYTVTLPKPLVENIETDVTFKIDEVEYSAKVKYEVPDLKVASVTNPNGGQIKIDFNQPVALTATLKEEEINKLVQVTGVNIPGKVELSKGELSADKKSLTVTIKGTKPLSEGRYNVVVKDIKTDKGLTLVKYDDVPSFVADNTAPAIAAIENVGATRIKVKFTEPVTQTVGSTQFRLANGVQIFNVKGPGITEPAEKNVTEVVYDLTNATVNGALLSPGSAITVTFGALVDLSNNTAPANTLTTTATIGNKDGVPPSLLNIEQMGARKFKLTFSEELRELKPEYLSITQRVGTFRATDVQKDEKNPTTYVVTLDTSLYDGDVWVSTKPGYYMTDLSGEVGSFSTSFVYRANTTVVPRYVSSEVVTEKGVQYLDLTFDNNILIKSEARGVAIKGRYVQSGKVENLTPKNATATKHPSKDNVLRIKLSDALYVYNDHYGATYFFEIDLLSNVTSEYGVLSDSSPYVDFVRGGDSVQNQNAIRVLGVETAAFQIGGSAINSNEIVITFSQAVQLEDAFTKGNYEFKEGGTVANIDFVPEVLPDNRKVKLTLKNGLREQQTALTLTINNIRALGSTAKMSPYTQDIVLSKNVSPDVTSARVTIVDSNYHSALLTFKTPIRIPNNNSGYDLAKVNIKGWDSNGNWKEETAASTTFVGNSNSYQAEAKFIIPTIKQIESIQLEILPNVYITDIYNNPLEKKKFNIDFKGYNQDSTVY